MRAPTALGLLHDHLTKAGKAIPFPGHYRGTVAQQRSGGGPGSRGGQVVGFTRSNKPIYRHDHIAHEKVHRIGSYDWKNGGVTLPRAQAVRAMHSSHPRWTFQDHMDASDHHLAAAKKEPDDKAALRMLRVGRAHLHAADDRMKRGFASRMGAAGQPGKPPV